MRAKIVCCGATNGGTRCKERGGGGGGGKPFDLGHLLRLFEGSHLLHPTLLQALDLGLVPGIGVSVRVADKRQPWVAKNKGRGGGQDTREGRQAKIFGRKRWQHTRRLSTRCRHAELNQFCRHLSHKERARIAGNARVRPPNFSPVPVPVPVPVPMQIDRRRRNIIRALEGEVGGDGIQDQRWRTGLAVLQHIVRRYDEPQKAKTEGVPSCRTRLNTPPRNMRREKRAPTSQEVLVADLPCSVRRTPVLPRLRRDTPPAPLHNTPACSDPV